jgi:hypothetical protein
MGRPGFKTHRRGAEGAGKAAEKTTTKIIKKGKLPGDVNCFLFFPAPLRASAVGFEVVPCYLAV